MGNQWLRVHILLIRSKSLLFSTLETIKTKTRGLGVCMISTRAKLTKTQQYPEDLKHTEGHVDDSDHGGNRPIPLPKIRHIKHKQRVDKCGHFETHEYQSPYFRVV